MTFAEIRAQVIELLQREGRVAYRVLKRQFTLDDEYLEDLKADLIDAKRVAVDEDGKVLVWVGASPVSGSKFQVSASQSPDSGPRTPDAGLSSGERRQLTVMFCDLVGSTALSEQLDPEELRDVVRAYQQTSAAVIDHYEGHIAQHLGDGLLVYFGYPLAHEDDAQRAVRTALGIVEAIQQLSFPTIPLPRPLQVRIGVHTGLVVVGEIGSSEKREMLALGETPNIAARLQGLAEPDTVVISAATYRLVEGLFECQDRGSQELKGDSTLVPVYRVLRESEAQSRFEAAVRTGLTPLVGRDEELRLLGQRWEQAKTGAGQVVLLTGEPGIGKSRLVQTLKEHASAEGATRIEFHCSPYHQNSAFYPIIEHLQRLLQFAREDSPTTKLEKLQYTLSHYRFPQADTLPLLAALLSLPHPEGYPLITVSPQKQKERTQAALVAWLVEEAAQNTVYNAWEDLHWADPSTLEVLALLLDQVPTTRLLAVLTFRPEFTPPWGNRSHLSQLTLRRLGRPHVETMVEQVTRGKVLPLEVLQQIVSKTDGVPLFVEELTKTVLESVESRESIESEGKLAQPSLRLGIPATLQDALMARLDRLGTVKELAQLGATLGREFSYELLHAVSPLDEDSLRQGLRQLVEVELLYQRGLPPQATYLFKHALIQDTAYHSLLKSKRQHYHQQIAQVLAEQFPETQETQPELLAHHYTEASLIEQALPYWQQAGERATQRSAYTEAVAHLTRGLEVLKTLPDTPERVQQELTILLALNNALVPVKGYTAPEVEKTVTRARALCQQLGETPQLFPVLYGLWSFYVLRREVQTARELAEQLMRLAQRVHDPYLLALAHRALGYPLYFLGELISAWTHAEQAIALYDPQQHPRDTVSTSDLRVVCLSYASLTLWCLGYPDQALKRSHEAVALAEELSHPFSLANALGTAAVFHLLRREEQRARERAEAVIALSTEQGFPYFLALGRMVRGGALAEQGQVQEGIAQPHQIWLGHALAQLAEAYGKAGQVEEGLTVLAEAQAFVDKTGMRVSEAELYRLKGELTLKQSGVRGPESEVQKEAEAYFLKAIEIARRQQAKSLELRAVMSLSRLWQQQGRQKDAHRMLAQIYGWFTEGFDTKDLQEAKALLEELSH